MNDVLKQRLVGALILVALGVVFWPIIFVEPDAAPSASEVRLPPRPNIDTRPLPSPDRVGLRASKPLELQDSELDFVEPQEHLVPEESPGEVVQQDSKSPEAAQVPVEPAQPVTPPPAAAEKDLSVASKTRSEPPVQPEIDAQGVPVAWMLQVVSVSRKESAENTRQRLQNMGHKAYIKTAQAGDKTVYRVYVGPKFERAKLDAIKADVDRQFGVKSMIRRYLP
ncbi:SPOR domain-containing protein [Parahaliea sp. F7430]|uniref:SPOR domain-containing protein n=1 Tax=Sediminihaliea albiluteola TaxID=2758564 RepID=A0A7W2TU69_9GAMM|nr:SPOR domain-containing protein [Sediminihaliea albiluteola]MBA6412044.1 SPOR domain-containing protein [Sediminihaliea albiluteola]